MKEGWMYTTLGESCDIKYGTRVVRARDGGSIYDVYGGGGATFKMDSYNRENCVVVARFAMSKQCTRYVSGKFFLNDSGLTVSPKKDSPLSQFLLDKLLIALNDTIYSYGRGSAQRNLNTKEFGKMPFAYPRDLSEQKRIVELLDAEFAKIDAIKANAEQQLQAAKDLFQAALKEMLTPKEGWKEKTLPDISHNLDGKRIPVTQNKRTAGIYPYYGASGIVDYVNDYIFDDTLLLISEDGANLLARTTPIAFTIKGKNWVNNHAHVIKIEDDSLRRYVEYYFANLNIEEYVTGAAQPKLTQKALNRIRISIPNDHSIINKIITALDDIQMRTQQLQSNYNQTLTLCNDLKQALLKSIFE